MTKRMPVIFLGHGSPMNAISDNVYADCWREIARSIELPKAILCVSAHWFTRGTGVTAMQHPPTIHDFYGFPPELHAFEYPAPGDPQLAAAVARLLAPTEVILDEGWGLDHGAWSVLARMYPAANVPVVQLSIDGTKPPSYHYELASRLKPLRSQGVLTVCSGNIVHGSRNSPGELNEGGKFLWAVDFEARVRDHIARGDFEPLLSYETWGNYARLAVPTPEHYLPLIYALGQVEEEDQLDCPVQGLEGQGQISMLGVRVASMLSEPGTSENEVENVFWQE